VKVLQGEREMAADNKLLGNFDLVGIPPAPRGVPQIEVTFDIDANGIVAVTAKDKQTGKEQQITIQSSGGLDKRDIERMIKDSETFAEADKKKRDAVEVRNSADSTIYNVEKSLNEHRAKLSQDVIQQIESEVAAVKDALKKDDIDPAALKSLVDKLGATSMKIGEQVYKTGGSAGSSAGGAGGSGESGSGSGDNQQGGDNNNKDGTTVDVDVDADKNKKQ